MAARGIPSFVRRAFDRIRPWRRSLLPAALICSVLLAGSPCLLAEEDQSPIDEAIEGLANWGPLYFRPRIELKDVGFDSNLYHQATGDEISSFTATLNQ